MIVTIGLDLFQCLHQLDRKGCDHSPTSTFLRHCFRLFLSNVRIIMIIVYDKMPTTITFVLLRRHLDSFVLLRRHLDSSLGMRSRGCHLVNRFVGLALFSKLMRRRTKTLPRFVGRYRSRWELNHFLFFYVRGTRSERATSLRKIRPSYS